MSPKPKRMNREEFFAKLSPLDAEQLRKALWNLYWRGSAPLRERIESELDPAEDHRRKNAAHEPPDPDEVLADVTEFAELARSGAYMAGDRRVTRNQRTKWRVTFRQLATDAQSALHAEDTGPAEQAMELMIDLACEARSGGYFRSEDPLEAARFVVSHAAAALWQTMLDRHGFGAFAERAAPQLIRWESRYGWTNGYGKVSGHETALAAVLEPMLTTPDMWAGFASAYLAALDAVARTGPARKVVGSWGFSDVDWTRRQRTENLAAWNGRLLDNLEGDVLDRLVKHPAFGGTELIFLQARLARKRGDLGRARRLIQECLGKLPGHQGFLDFALEVGAELPPASREKLEEQARLDAMMEAQRRE
jgi:hypothetical protein